MLKGLLAFFLLAILWIGPIVALCFAPWKVLAVLGGVCVFSFGIAPAIAFLAWMFLSFLLMEALGFNL